MVSGPLTRRPVYILVFCLAGIGFYMYMFRYFMGQEPNRNGTESARNPAKRIEEHIPEIDTGTNQIGESVETIGVEKNKIDLDSMTPEELWDRTAIVTATSQNHLKESKGMIGSVQEVLPHKRIIVFDLGLTPQGVSEVKRLCNVELRSFNFTKYPPHVKDLHTYAWKPLIIGDMLDEFGVVFYSDASARLRRDPLVLFPILKKLKGFMARVVEYASTNIFARTHPKMFDVLGIDKKTFAKDDGYAMCMEGSPLLFVNTDLVQTKIVAPWLDCALRQGCIAPAGSVLRQHVKGPVKFTHRFDQAALALIVYKNLRGVMYKGNDQTKLFSDVVGLTKTPKGFEKAKFCT